MVVEVKVLFVCMCQVVEFFGGKVLVKIELELVEVVVLWVQVNEVSVWVDVVQVWVVLKIDEINFGKVIICLLVDGVVLICKVELGQMVVVLMMMLVLFVLVENLVKMELQVKVDEVDVGNVKNGQKVMFIVLVWLGWQFLVIIQCVGFGLMMIDNVVIYKIIFQVSNDDFVLWLGMMVSVVIVIVSCNQVLLVLNVVLCFILFNVGVVVMSWGLVVSLMLGLLFEVLKVWLLIGVVGEVQVWVLGEKVLQVVVIKIGVSNGCFIEVLGGDLQVGMVVIIDYQEVKQ